MSFKLSNPSHSISALHLNLLLLSSSHVAKTGDIKDLVIMEEAGIAKGIRRIIAVTGAEAKQASLSANATEAAFQKIVKLEGKEKEKAIKVYELVSFIHFQVSSFI